MFPLILSLSILALVTGCKKFIEVPAPTTSTNGANVYTNDATATSVLTGVYAKMTQTNLMSGGIPSISFYSGLSADELTPYSLSNSSIVAYYRNQLTPSTTNFWSTLYSTIFVVNSAVEGIEHSNSLTLSVKNQLLGEAKFVRAFCYFYLLNFFGNVPLTTSTDFEVNRLLDRSSTTEVWQQIIRDLKDAQSQLSPVYLKGDVLTNSSERVRPSKWAATALLSRVYLFMRNWVDAEKEATSLISNSSLFSLDILSGVFNNDSKEAIWQLQPVNIGWNTEDAKVFNLSASPSGLSGNKPVYLSTFVLNAFEPGDNRRTNWVDIYTDAVGDVYAFPYKYKIATLNAPVTEYETVLRLGEQFLIRAEARAQQNNLAGAQDDLNAIRTRAGLANTTASTQSDILNAILHERQVELFTEWGHRWLDLKRTGKVDEVMGTVTSQKGGSWNTNWQWYPVITYDLQTNPNLTQNRGY